MTQSRSVCSRIRNARASLDNAERNFRCNQEVRGELDLMLAEAELDNLRQKRSRFSWTRHMLAACFAVLLLASGCLGWWWASAYGGNTTNAAGLQGMPTVWDNKNVITKTENTADVPRQNSVYSSAVPDRNPVEQEISAAPGPAGGATQQQAENRGRSISLSSSEMRQLIRSGKQELGNMR